MRFYGNRPILFFSIGFSLPMLLFSSFRPIEQSGKPKGSHINTKQIAELPINKELQSSRQALQNLIHGKLTKGEFETSEEFKVRQQKDAEYKKKRISEIINNVYEAKFLISLQPYDADNQLFAATLRSSGLDLNVHFSVPRDSAPLFKQESIGAIASGRFWLESDENIYQAAPIRVMIGGSEFQTTESGPGIAFLDWRSTPIPGSQYDDSRIAAFEKTGSLAAVGSMQDTYHPQLSLIDMKNGNTNQLDVGRTNAISFSNDGAKLAAYVEGILKIWNLASLQMQYQLSVDKNPIGDFYATVFSPDNQKVAASYGWYNTNALSNVTKGSGVVRVFDMATGKQLWIYEASKDMWPTYVAYSADGKLLAARFAWREKNQRNWKVFIWNTENWQVAQELSSSN